VAAKRAAARAVVNYLCVCVCLFHALYVKYICIYIYI